MHRLKISFWLLLGFFVFFSYGCEDKVVIPSPKPPVASAGSSSTVLIGVSVNLNGSASDVNFDPITYSWTVVSAPATSVATITNPTQQTASFTPDVEGTYTIQLIANDGTYDSTPSTITITSVDPANTNDPGPEGDISFTLFWSWSGSLDPEGPDIDLWVEDPLGQRLSSSRTDFSLGPTPEGGIIDFDDQGQTAAIPGDGGGPERAYWPIGQAPAGTYTYGIRYYIGTGTAFYTLNVYKNTTLVDSISGAISTDSSDVQVGTVVN